MSETRSNGVNTDVVFILKQEDSLPDYFEQLSLEFSRLHVKLIPVTLDQLQQFFNGKDKIHLIVLTRSKKEMNYFVNRVRPIMNYVLKTNLLSLYHLSSFSWLNMSSVVTRLKRYHFTLLPVKMNILASTIKIFLDRDKKLDLRWPGGKRGSVKVINP
jgi:hypothetical protein